MLLLIIALILHLSSSCNKVDKCMTECDPTLVGTNPVIGMSSIHAVFIQTLGKLIQTISKDLSSTQTQFSITSTFHYLKRQTMIVLK